MGFGKDRKDRNILLGIAGAGLALGIALLVAAGKIGGGSEDDDDQDGELRELLRTSDGEDDPDEDLDD
ncbi:MAG: hypothetical protein I3I98_06090 [Mobilibacterium timonense]|uniref:hypothetical protein n=1 Tax=Mobilibacterium timonense TaxID=1871012 RepID=UPI000984A31A|nr:hypothetical protein [Mobilibacterium timonense]MBM6990948.1 hypothetical protein [Mobilibacterium timonense]